MLNKKIFFLLGFLAILLSLGSFYLVTARDIDVAHAQTSTCAACHTTPVNDWMGSRHDGVACETCHEGSAAHELDPMDPVDYPRVHFDMEVCQGCHLDQYNTFEVEARGKTIYGGSDGGILPPKGWSKTADLPYWNVLIDGHPFVLETYEDSPMSVNQIEHQETIRPGSEACMECHGTRAAFIKGFEYQDKNGVVHSIPATKWTTTLPNGQVVDIPAREYTVKYQGHTIYDGTSFLDPLTGEWTEAITTITVPQGTRIWTYTDGVNLSGGAYPQKYQVKTLVTLPAPVTVDVLDKTGAVVGSVTFDTIASYPEAGADINGVTGFSPPALADGNVATVARNWIYAVMEALAFDGLDYYFDDPHGETHFTGGGSNWPSVVSGELCNQCHNPHSGELRIVRKALIAAIAERGINPYSPTGRNILTFEEASRQDQIIAVCAQCHSEYVGGYSANTGLDQDYFPWAKPTDLENQYRDLFGYLQDWTHGAPIVPWQSIESNARGFLPYSQRYTIEAPLVKVQHPEAEVFFNSPMYNAGATCTDCHSTRITRPDGTKYTNHWFTSPIKLMEGFDGNTVTGEPITVDPQNPCRKCHTTDTNEQSYQRIKDQQDVFFFLQERTQVALVNALRFINEQQALGVDQSTNINTYQRASMRWEYYTQAENSMGFHNNPEASTEVANARLWVDAFIPWPLTPVKVRVTGAGETSLTLTFYDQAKDEQGFILERALALEGPYTQVADLPTPNGANIGDVTFTDTSLAADTGYFYRVSAYNASGVSVPSIWGQGATLPATLAAPTGLTATAISTAQIDLLWIDNSLEEIGFRIERALDAGFTSGLAVFDVPADQTTFSDSGLLPDTTYYYRVFATGASGLSDPSNTASATTFPAPPNAPTNLVVSSVGQTSVSLRWKDNANNEAGFYVERCTADCGASGAGWSAIATLAPNTTTFTNTGLKRRTTYYYRVQAFNLTGVSAYSNIVKAKTR